MRYLILKSTIGPVIASLRHITLPTAAKDPRMLDVHAPYETVHTRRDFFIHIATICVGLLIAIAIEQ